MSNHKILLSAHKDTVSNHYRMAYENGKFVGLLDNWIGRMVIEYSILSNKSVSFLVETGEIGIFYGDGEEFSLDYDFPKLNKDCIVIVVDVESGSKFKGYPFILENISGFSDKEIKELKENLEWEGFVFKANKFSGNLDDNDESWSWKEKGYKVISFNIILQDKGITGWHSDCCISIENVRVCSHALIRLINYLR